LFKYDFIKIKKAFPDLERLFQLAELICCYKLPPFQTIGKKQQQQQQTIFLKMLFMNYGASLSAFHKKCKFL